MAATNKKAEGVATPTANVLHLCNCNCARGLQSVQAPPDATTVQTYIGAALRHCRAGASFALRDGASPRVARQLKRARDALDCALWLCSYCEADK